MTTKQLYTEAELASLAQEARRKSGKSMAEVARMFGVSRSVIFNAEKKPERSLLRVRKSMIERLSDQKVKGPWFTLEG